MACHVACDFPSKQAKQASASGSEQEVPVCIISIQQCQEEVQSDVMMLLNSNSKIPTDVKRLL